MTTIIDGSASADFATPLPLTEGGTGIATATTAIVQIVNTQTGAVATGTTVMPVDDTIPQNTEGNEYMTLAITPKHADNKLNIEVVAQFGHSVNTAITSGALFKDSVASAVAAAIGVNVGTNGISSPIVINYTVVAGSTSATTYKVRIGSSSAGTTTFNGDSGGRKFGGVMSSSITITEYTA
jgi:hypothetical protein